MAPAKDKWVRRFIIPETTRHKKGFTIYKITSLVFLKSSYEEISKVSVWKRYNDFKKLHSELAALHARSQIKESFPKFPKAKFFDRFEAEVIQKRREYALKFLDFIGRHSCLYSSDIFIKFFETSHRDSSQDCSQSLSSDTSEEDRHLVTSATCNNDNNSQDIFGHLPKDTDNCQKTCDQELAKKTSQNGALSYKVSRAENSNLKPKEDIHITEEKLSAKNSDLDKLCCSAKDKQSLNTKNNNIDTIDSMDTYGRAPIECNNSVEESKSAASIHDGSDLPQSWPDSSQYILIAAAHMSAAFRHEAMSEYEEAFTQYKMGISNLLNGVQSDADTVRAEIIKEKIAKYLERAEKLYNRHLNCNISLLNKPVSELQYYKVVKIMRSVMLVRDLRQNCLRIVKAVEKSCGSREGISNYILRGQVPYMVRLHACVETETTVFLILDYLSRGKLWDFVIEEYKPQDSTSYHISRVQENNIDVALDGGTEAFQETDVEEAVNPIDASIAKPDYASTSPRVQTAVEEAREVYGTDVPTTQLLEKAQMLLQSVNATLKESNTITSRLREYKDLLTHPNNTASLNMKNATCQQEKWDIILTEVNDAPVENHSINRTELQPRGLLHVQNTVLDDAKGDKSPDVTDSSSLTDSYTDLSFSERDSSSYSLDNSNSKSISAYSPNERNGGVKAENIVELRTTFKADRDIEESNYVISDGQIEYLLTEYTRNNNLDVDEELWAIPEHLIRLWAAEILLAIEALHQQEVIVFDLKPDNILLDDNGHVQLTYITPHHSTTADLTKHKQPYASPELCMFLPTIPITTATDIWSFGVILYELTVGDKFQTRHPGLFHSHSIVNIPSKLCENTKSLLLNLLRYAPHERMTIPEIKQHPYFEEIDWASLVNPHA